MSSSIFRIPGSKTVLTRASRNILGALAILAIAFLASRSSLAQDLPGDPFLQTTIGFAAQVRYGVGLPVETRSPADTLDRPQHRPDVRLQPRDPWLSFDKVQHFTFSALFTVGGQYALETKMDWNKRNALPIAVFTSFTIGLTKELYDWQAGPRRYFSWRDMAANGAGIVFATGFILL